MAFLRRKPSARSRSRQVAEIIVRLARCGNGSGPVLDAHAALAKAAAPSGNGEDLPIGGHIGAPEIIGVGGREIGWISERAGDLLIARLAKFQARGIKL